MIERDGDVVRCTLSEWLEHGPAIMRKDDPPCRVYVSDRRPRHPMMGARSFWDSMALQTADAENGGE